MECVVPVQPSRSSSSISAHEPSPARLSRWQALFLPSTVPRSPSEDDFSILPAVSEHIQTQFVAKRQASASSSAPIPGATPPASNNAGKSSAAGGSGGGTQEDLVLRLGVARLLCVSEGRRELDVETWERTEALDEARKGRLASMSA